MADYIVYHKCTAGDIFDLLAIEVKAPGKSSSSQLQNDLVKTGKDMKSFIDRLATSGVYKPKVHDLFVDGYTCTTFTMQLIQDDAYLMQE
ncbi:hypothetical protein BDA99DRAFT_493214 [Phascolomyces articulosus]|uniref:Uncharacterized protein n=1 Tax=Phascolomyces articulosus TaxID=60185 RepID=A0AAD5KS96_9FUNG|nr:hypothetical protein BDA99DRAFT_493214 [Phascolomyces articulosus]